VPAVWLHEWAQTAEQMALPAATSNRSSYNQRLVPVVWAAIAEQVYWPWEMNPGEGEIFRTRTDRPWGPPKLLYDGYRAPFPGVNRPRRGVNHPPHLEPRLKK
jgi:hypothetical protein